MVVRAAEEEAEAGAVDWGEAEDKAEAMEADMVAAQAVEDSGAETAADVGDAWGAAAAGRLCFAMRAARHMPV